MNRRFVTCAILLAGMPALGLVLLAIPTKRAGPLSRAKTGVPPALEVAPDERPMEDESLDLTPNIDWSSHPYVSLQKEEIRHLLRTLTDESELALAVEAFLRFRDVSREDAEVLIRRLDHARDGHPVEMLLRAIGTCWDPIALETIRRRAGEDPRPAVRRAAVLCLFSMKRVGTEEEHLQGLLRETDSEIRCRWVNLLATFKTDRAARILVDLVRSSEEPASVRLEALENLALFRDAAMIRLIAKDPAMPNPLQNRAEELVTEM